MLLKESWLRISSGAKTKTMPSCDTAVQTTSCKERQIWIASFKVIKSQFHNVEVYICHAEYIFLHNIWRQHVTSVSENYVFPLNFLVTQNYLAISD